MKETYLGKNKNLRNSFAGFISVYLLFGLWIRLLFYFFLVENATRVQHGEGHYNETFIFNYF